MKTNAGTPDLEMDATQLYREESFTDRRVGSLRCMTPVLPDGTPDSSRSIFYVGETQLMTPMGALPLSFEIPAANLKEAVQKFGENAEDAAQRAIEELKEMRRQSASSLIVPERGGMPSGPAPGAGKIQLR